MTDKELIMMALTRFAEQRPGLDPANYFSGGNWIENRRNYDNERRSIHTDLKQFRTLWRAVRWRDSITAYNLIDASRDAYSGRLTITRTDAGGFAIDYCTGQYFPTEYRRAACAVLALALWANVREYDMPAPVITNDGERYGSLQCLSAGDWLRAHFRREFGRGIAARWFN